MDRKDKGTLGPVLLAWIIVIIWVAFVFPFLATARAPDRTYVEALIIFASVPLVAAIVLIYISLRAKLFFWAYIATATVFFGVVFAAFYYCHKKDLEDIARSTCMSNTRQLSLALIMYSDNWDEQLPPAEIWVEGTYPYIGNSDVYKCPEDKSETACSYALNANLSSINRENIENAENLVLLYETAHPGANPAGTGADLPPEGRHKGKINIALADGHVKWVKSKQALTEFEWRPRSGEEQ